MSSSIGIIGGADGPTAIFMSSGTSLTWVVIGTLIAIIGIVGVIIAYFSRKNK